jgi:hypothetical protein
MILVTSAIRPAGVAASDQKRTMTPAAAIATGADYLVVGGPVTQAKNPREAAEAIISEIAPPSSLKTPNTGRTSGPARDPGASNERSRVEANIDNHHDGAMTSSLLKAQFGDKNGGAAVLADAFPCGHRGL